MKRIVLIAMLVLLGAVATAQAVPVRDVDLQEDGFYAHASATIYSPPTAAGCGAYYLIRVTRNVPGNPRYAQRSGRLNVCRDQDPSSGWSRGEVRVDLNVLKWPVSTYTICVAASQTLVNGNVSRHAACRVRRV